MSKNNYLNLTDFAKIVGVTRRAVVYAVEKNKIKSKMIKGCKMVHGPSAKKEWYENTDPKASAKGKQAWKKKGPTKEEIDNGVIIKPKTYDGLTLADAQRQDTVYKARLSQLKYLEQAGKLVEVDKIQRQAFEMGRKVRDSLLSLPPRFAHELAAETDPHSLEMKLTKEITAALDKIIGEKNDKR